MYIEYALNHAFQILSVPFFINVVTVFLLACGGCKKVRDKLQFIRFYLFWIWYFPRDIFFKEGYRIQDSKTIASLLHSQVGKMGTFLQLFLIFLIFPQFFFIFLSF